jgi:hypothetical protein
MSMEMAVKSMEIAVEAMESMEMALGALSYHFFLFLMLLR